MVINIFFFFCFFSLFNRLPTLTTSISWHKTNIWKNPSFYITCAILNTGGAQSTPSIWSTPTASICLRCSTSRGFDKKLAALTWPRWSWRTFIGGGLRVARL